VGKKGEGAELPVLGGIWASIRDAGPPTIDQARERLGGAWQGGPGVGDTVSLSGATGAQTGVVVHASPTERDVWIGAGRIRRVGAYEVRPPPEGPGPELAAIADDARVHASLREGQRVVYQTRDGATGTGVLAEKLRYGSLVGLEDGRVIAVSFRRLGPTGDEPVS
jgi:hypothetical protein